MFSGGPTVLLCMSIIVLRDMRCTAAQIRASLSPERSANQKHLYLGRIQIIQLHFDTCRLYTSFKPSAAIGMSVNDAGMKQAEPSSKSVTEFRIDLRLYRQGRALTACHHLQDQLVEVLYTCELSC
jgi:hypothetical protein